MSGPAVPRRWVVLLAVKPLPLAKSRLNRPDRSALTLAMAADTATAAAGAGAVEAVLVVTDDADAGALLSPVAVIVPDTPDAGLNPALAHGAAEAARRWPELGIVVLAADLPALRPATLTAALTLAAAHRRAVVADASGTGTVLLAAAPGVALAPSFGPGSRHRHLGAAADLTDVLATGAGTAGLRHDVDTAADLDIAVSLGVGPATAQVLAAAGDFTVEWHTSAVTHSGAPDARPRT